MSRLLQRLRETFRDEVLMRGPPGYELALRARQLLAPFAAMLLKIDRLIAGPRLDPLSAKETFRIALTDYAALVITTADGGACSVIARHSARPSGVERPGVQ